MIAKLIFGVFWAIVARVIAFPIGPAFGAAEWTPHALRYEVHTIEWVVAVALVIATCVTVDRMRGPRGASDRLAFTLANLYLLDLAAYGGCALAWWPRSHVATLLLLGLQLPLAVTALAIRSETAWTRYLPFHLG